MNQPHDVYRQAQISKLENAEPRMVEGWALSQLADRLEHAYKVGQANHKDILPIIRLNWQVWTLIQSHLVDEKCLLPDDVRQNLLSLTNFIDKQTVRIIGRKDLGAIPALININRQISAGLLDNNGGVLDSANASFQAMGHGSSGSETSASTRAQSRQQQQQHSSDQPSQASSSTDHSAASDSGVKKYNFVRIKNN